MKVLENPAIVVLDKDILTIMSMKMRTLTIIEEETLKPMGINLVAMEIAVLMKTRLTTTGDECNADSENVHDVLKMPTAPRCVMYLSRQESKMIQRIQRIQRMTLIARFKTVKGSPVCS